MTKNGSLVFVEELAKNGPAVGIDLEFFPSAQLGKLQDVPTMLSSGIADISGVVPAYLSSLIPMSSVFDLPGSTEDSCAGARAVSRSVAEGTVLREKEVDKLGIVPLWSVFLQGYELMTTGDEPVMDPAEEKGAILRSPGGAVDRVVDEMGAAGVGMPLGEMYEALSRGTVDGTVASPISMAPYKLSEVLSQSTIGANLGAVTVLYSMSEETWNALNAEQRRVVQQAAAAAELSVCQSLNTLLVQSRDAMAKDGTNLNVLTPEQQQVWSALGAPARASWQSDLDSMGLPATEVLMDWERVLAEESGNE
ncbi:TRAP transporter substrate-binding protein DctP [Nocardia sp. NPDC058518]|uniref:TRAP transporter substrate-binding protein DctP n=1 Tax=Nocardia sp. NPDC058518 TaxID=3346534 RepID=UPI00364ACA4C